MPEAAGGEFRAGMEAASSLFDGKSSGSAKSWPHQRQLRSSGGGLAGCGNKPAGRLISFYGGVDHGFGGRCEAFGAPV
jgi:hypothetical protein